jgi:hypothetical protein
MPTRSARSTRPRPSRSAGKSQLAKDHAPSSACRERRHLGRQPG